MALRDTRVKTKRRDVNWAAKDRGMTSLSKVLAGVIGIVLGAVITAIVALQPRLDTASDVIAELGIILGAVTLALVTGQIIIAFRQTELQERELSLVYDQGKILAHQEAEMNRKARLVLWSIPGPPLATTVPTTATLHERDTTYPADFFITNTGNRSAAKCRIMLLLPKGVYGLIGPYYQWRENIGTERLNGDWCRKTSLDLDDVFFEGDDFPLQVVTVRLVPSVSQPIMYRLVYADGATPSHAGWLPLKGSKNEAIADALQSDEERRERQRD